MIEDWVLLIVRIAFGLILIYHGWPKIKDLSATAKSFNKMGFKPGWLFGTLAGLLEFFGGIMIIIGFLTVIPAALFAIQMAVVIIWKFKNRAGIEFDLALLLVSLLLVTFGAGFYSVDSVVLGAIASWLLGY